MHHHLATLVAAILLSLTGSLFVVQAVPISTSWAENEDSFVSLGHAALRVVHMMVPGADVSSAYKEPGLTADQQPAPQLAGGEALVVPPAPYNQDWEMPTFAPPGQAPLISPPSTTSSALPLLKAKGLQIKIGDEGEGDIVREQGPHLGPKAGLGAKHEHLSDDWEW